MKKKIRNIELMGTLTKRHLGLHVDTWVGRAIIVRMKTGEIAPKIKFKCEYKGCKKRSKFYFLLDGTAGRCQKAYDQKLKETADLRDQCFVCQLHQRGKTK